MDSATIADERVLIRERFCTISECTFHFETPSRVLKKSYVFIQISFDT